MGYGTRFYGYQIWKPVNSEARNAVLEQMQINNRFENQPMPDNYKLVSEEIIDVYENSSLMRGTPGYGTTIWDMARNYREFKGKEAFEMGDVICIFHTNEDRRYGSCFLTVGSYFYGWDEKENHLLRDNEKVQQAWATATKTNLY